MIAPNGTLGTDGNFGTVPQFNGVPADSAPFVNPQNEQRPIIDRIETLPDSSPIPSGSTFRAVAPQNNNTLPVDPTPAVVSYGNYTAKASPIRKKWSYTPVRQASYTSTAATEQLERRPVRKQPIRITGNFQANKPAQKSSSNSAWETVEW